MSGFATENFHCCSVRGKPIGDDLLRYETLIFEQFSQQFQGCGSVAPLLHEDIQNFAFLVDGSPHIAQATDDPGDHPKAEPLATNSDDHLIQMPYGIGTAAPAPNVRRDRRTELVHPASNSLAGDVDTTLGEQIFDVAKAQSERIIEPNSEPDDVWWKAMTFQRNGIHIGLSIGEKPPRGDWLQLD